MDVRELAQELIRKGNQKGASDLYLLPGEKRYQLSYRYHQNKWVDSYLKTEIAEQLILYFKYSAEMDIAEKRKIQVGAMTVTLGTQQKRIRLSTVADYKNRESLVIRFLQEFDEQDRLHYFFKKQLNTIRENVQRRGLFLFCGPTGSGKTTTMYRLAREISTENRQVITIEDPVEINESRFLQLQTNQKIALDYEQLVKVCLRHRPDVLIIGEIRDQETAKMVIRGALTGHTIFSTLHTGKKEEVFSRLKELGVSDNELQQAVKGIVFQRLLPKKCGLCTGSCSKYCQQSTADTHYGVLFDTLFFEGGQTDWEKKHNSWEKNLSKVWALGFISDQIYRLEKGN